MILNIIIHLGKKLDASSEYCIARNFTEHSSSHRLCERKMIGYSMHRYRHRLHFHRGVSCDTRNERERRSVAMLYSFYRRALHRNIKRGLPGCAYINNNCRANNKLEGSTLDSPKLLVPLPRAARFYCLLSSVRNGGSPLHRPRWRINDPAIRRRAANANANANARFSFSLSVSLRLCCLRVRITCSGVPRHLVQNRSRARKEPQKRAPHAR